MRALPMGDRAILLEVASLDDVLALHAALEESRPAGVVDLVPAARTVIIRVDPGRLSLSSTRAWAETAAEAATGGGRTAGTEVVLDIAYDGPDLAETAALLGVSAADLAERHASARWTVAFTGFAPGFGYLVSPAWRFDVPRLDSPRTRVPAGAVGLAAEFTGAYPRETPGGWRLIGTTSAQLFDPDAAAPALLAPGASVRFRPVREVVRAAGSGSGPGPGPGPEAEPEQGPGPEAEPEQGPGPERGPGSGRDPSVGAQETRPDGANPPQTRQGRGFRILEPGLGQGPEPAVPEPGSEPAPEPESGPEAEPESGRGPERGPGSGRDPSVGAQETRPDGANPPQTRQGRGIRILEPGLLATTQDLGRPGAASLGVSPSGALDRTALRTANRLLGNPEGAAAIEVTMGGLRATADEDQWFAVTGAWGRIQLAGREIDPYEAHRWPAGDELHLDWFAHGTRAYLAVRGGVGGRAALGSRATDLLAGLGPQPLRAGDVVPILRDAVDPIPVAQLAPWGAPHDEQLEIALAPGARAEWFTASARRTLFDAVWTVSNASDRIGMRLDGPALERAVDGELPSEGMVPGAIQVPPTGRPTILLADGPVTGGYPVIAVVADAALDLLAQARPGTLIRFRHTR